MGLLSLTKDGVSFLLDENDITRVYSLDGVVKVEYLKANGGTLDTITVEESLATIDAASDELIELTSNGVAFLLNYTIIRQVLTEGSGSKVIYEKLQTQSVVVEETPTEINALINAPSTQPLRYKALLSQDAPISTTQTPNIFAGQIWEDTIGTANAGDLVILGGYELISGTLGAVNAKYRSATDDTPNFTTASLEYDGSPYVVSTDVNGDFNPFINTIGNIVFSYTTVGRYSATLIGSFEASKTNVNINKLYATVSIPTGDLIAFRTWDDAIQTTPTDGMLDHAIIEIEVYP